MDLELYDLLRGPHGRAALAAAAALADAPPLAAAERLRAAGFPPPLAAAALTQTALRRQAVAKFGLDASVMLFTRAGLEQATRGAVAVRRAARLAAAGVGHLTDLGCGLGADALAAARAGIRVLAVEADPLTAALAAHNAEALGLADRVTVRVGDATAVALDDTDAVFCDPARRRGGSRVFDPAAYRPPWDFVAALPTRVPRTVLKLAPGIDHALLPPDAEGEWVSVDGDLVEATVWCGPLAGPARRATLLRSAGRAVRNTDAVSGSGNARAADTAGNARVAGAAGNAGVAGTAGNAGVAGTAGNAATGTASAGATDGPGVASLTGGGDRTAPVGRPSRGAGDLASVTGRGGGGRRITPQAPVAAGCVLYDPDPAVVRAHLVAEFAETVGGWLGDPRVAYVYADGHTPTPYARAIAVTDVLPFSLKRLRALLRARGVGRLEIMKRSSPLDPHTLRRQLAPAGPHAATLVLTRIGNAPLALLGHPAPLAR